MKTDLSIIIPTYNNLSYLKRAISSLENQTVKNFETIVVIDGSSDGTLDFLKNYNKKKINLKYVFIKASGGPAKPRNIGIKLSIGKWICFLDADDEWYNKKIEEVNVAIKNNCFDILYHKEILINKKKMTVINKKKYKDNLYLNLLLNGNICSTSATVVNKNFINKNKIKFIENKRFNSVEDYGFWLDIARSGGKFFFLNKILGYYHINDQNLTTQIFWHKSNMIKLLFHHVFVINKDNNNIKKIWSKIILLYKIDVLFLKIFRFKKYYKICEIFNLFIKKPFLIIIYLRRKLNI